MKIFNSKILVVQPRSLILIFIVLTIIIFSSLLLEYFQRKAEFNKLMQAQTHALLETTTLSLQNALITGQEVEQQLSQRLLNNAVLIKVLLSDGKISNKLLQRIAKENDILHINIFNDLGEKIYSTNPETIKHDNISGPIKVLYPIFEGLTDTLIIGLHESHNKDGYRYIVGLATDDDGAIVLVLDGEKIFDFRKRLGLGVLLKNLTSEPRIIYSGLQDTSGFLAASGKYTALENIKDSPFLSSALNDSVFNWRLYENDSISVFEAVKTFKANNRVVGLLRVGVSLETLKEINQKFITRLTISSIILIIAAFVIISFIFATQNIKLLKRQYNVVETYSEKILFNVTDAILVLNENLIIKSVNKMGSILFSGNNIIGKQIFDLIDDSLLNKLLYDDITSIQITPILNGFKKIFNVSKSSFQDENNKTNYILVFNDLTEQRLLEEKVERQERLAAMGELASGVAHEIRNPLNTIGTISQQLSKDFLPADNKDEYINLTKLVYSEVKRINKTIVSFLKFARPEPLTPSNFEVSEIINQLANQYSAYFSQKEINFIISANWNGIVNWDKNKILQALINLLQNAFDATPQNGDVTFLLENINNNVIISISDSGEGIPEDKLNKIFNLYYTTKAKGTGIGLSITQRIIYEHNGIITVNSRLNEGTSFYISLPVLPFDNKGLV